MPESKTMSTVYIAGPMTGLPEFNYEAFHRAAAILRASGYKVISPAEGSMAQHTKLPWSFFMIRALLKMAKADEVYFLRGWEKSKGARIEHRVSRWLGMKHSFEPDPKKVGRGAAKRKKPR